MNNSFLIVSMITKDLTINLPFIIYSVQYIVKNYKLCKQPLKYDLEITTKENRTNK